MPSSFKTILVWILAVSLQLALLGCVVGCGEQAGEKVFVSHAELHSAESPDECSLNFLRPSQPRVSRFYRTTFSWSQIYLIICTTQDGPSSRLRFGKHPSAHHSNDTYPHSVFRSSHFNSSRFTNLLKRAFKGNEAAHCVGLSGLDNCSRRNSRQPFL